MAGYNRVVLVGNLTRDPEYKQLSSGQAVCRLGLATNRQFKNKQSGSMVQEVCYVDIDVWGPQAESCNQYLQKGRPVLIEGRLKFDTWEDNAGQARSKHSIVADRVVFLSSAADAAEGESVEDTVQTGPQISPAPRQAVAAAPAAPRVQKAPAPSTLDAALEKELNDQIEHLKRKNSQKKMESASKADDIHAGGEIDFKDQAPFADELPF